MKSIILHLFFFLFLWHISFAQSEVLRGAVYDNQSGTPLAGAVIRIDKTSYGGVSNKRGQFEFKNVPPGRYTLVVEYIGYYLKRTEVTIHPGENSFLKIELISNVNHLSTLEVFGKLDETSEAASRVSEKEASNITNIISANAMRRSPDINAANVLQRLSGITLQKNSASDESYAIIRGMEPRYNNTLVNGIKIASSDEKSGFIALNIIPSGLLERITVDKSLMPDMEGDAIGGTVDLIMKNAPDSLALKANASLGYNQFFFQRGFTWFPKSEIQALSPLQRNPAGYAAKPNDFSRSNLDFSFPASPPFRKRSPNNVLLSLQLDFPVCYQFSVLL